jgi:hypothetical protein
VNDIPATFNHMIPERFRYLIDQYNFSIIKTGDGFQYSRIAEGYVELASPTTFVTVTGERYMRPGNVISRS